jgi:hypothetical protein
VGEPIYELVLNAVAPPVDFRHSEKLFGQCTRDLLRHEPPLPVSLFRGRPIHARPFAEAQEVLHG